MSLVNYEKKGKIAFIQLNRPEKRNALNLEMVNELIASWIAFRDDDSLWVAVLGGAGESFCGGMDLQDQPSDNDLKAKTWERPSIISTSRSLMVNPQKYEIWKPIIAAVHGHVVGAGLWMALGCDLIIAAEGTKLGAPEAKFNMATTFSAPMLYHTFPKLAYEILLVGDFISAQRAYEGGLVNKVVGKDQLIPAAMAIGERICLNGPLAVRAMKEMLQRSRDMNYSGMLAFMEHVTSAARTSEDREEAMKAFREKREPQWKGR